MGTESRARWAAVVFDLPTSLEDEVAGSLAGDCLGVELSRRDEGRSRVKLYVDSDTRAAALLEEVPERLRRWRLSPSACAVRLESVADGHWVERYQERLRPFPIGERFVVVPHDEAPAEDGRRRIHLVPGRAFGTGEHPTTRMAMEALERWVRPGSSWLDLGCGTGILAVAAFFLGAGRVAAKDLDPEAVEVAREVLARNGLDGRIEVATGSAGDLADGSFDGIVANIAARYFVSSAGEVARTLRRGGILVATGFLAEEAEEVARSLASAGCERVEERASGEWSLAAARRG